MTTHSSDNALPEYEWQRGMTSEQMRRFDGIYRSAHKWRTAAHKQANLTSELMERIAQLEDEVAFLESLNEMTLRHADILKGRVERVRNILDLYRDTPGIWSAESGLFFEMVDDATIHACGTEHPMTDHTSEEVTPPASACWCGSAVGFRPDKGFVDCLADRTHDWRGRELGAGREPEEVTLTDDECDEMRCACRFDYHELDSCLVPAAERIIAARVAEAKALAWFEGAAARATGLPLPNPHIPEGRNPADFHPWRHDPRFRNEKEVGA